MLPKEKWKPWLLFPFPIGSLPANVSKQKGAGSMTGSLTVHWTLERSGVSDSPGKETLIYRTIFGIKTETSQFFPFLPQGYTNSVWVYD